MRRREILTDTNGSPKLVGKFVTTSANQNVKIMYAKNYFDYIKIDGTKQTSFTTGYTFSTIGEHTVEYILVEPDSMGSQTFRECTDLTSITIPNTVTTIGNSSFYGCSGLKNIVIPDNVKNIGSSAFQNCISLTACTIGSGVTGVTSANTIFSGCTSIANVTIDNNLCTSNMFKGKTSITSVTFGNHVTSISASSFSGCTGLINCTIGSGVTTIGNYVFRSCSSIRSITSHAVTAPTVSSSTFQAVKTGGTLYVPSGSSGYNTWMGTGNYYLGKYSWSKIEQ